MRWLRTLAAGAALVLGGAACGEDEPRTGATAGGEGGSTTTAGAGAGGTTTTGATTPPGEVGPTTTTGGGSGSGDSATTTTTSGSDGGPEPVATDPNGPDFSIFTLPECLVVLDERGPGQDTLNVFFQLRSNGPTFPTGFFAVYAFLDRGVDAQVFASPGGGDDGRSFSVVQVPIDGGHYGGEAFLSLTADPDNEVVERDESNNSVTIRFPSFSRPSVNGDAIECELA